MVKHLAGIRADPGRLPLRRRGRLHRRLERSPDDRALRRPLRPDPHPGPDGLQAGYDTRQRDPPHDRGNRPMNTERPLRRARRARPTPAVRRTPRGGPGRPTAPRSSGRTTRPPGSSTWGDKVNPSGDSPYTGGAARLWRGVLEVAVPPAAGRAGVTAADRPHAARPRRRSAHRTSEPPAPARPGRSLGVAAFLAARRARAWSRSLVAAAARRPAAPVGRGQADESSAARGRDARQAQQFMLRLNTYGPGCSTAPGRRCPSMLSAEVQGRVPKR